MALVNAFILAVSVGLLVYWGRRAIRLMARSAEDGSVAEANPTSGLLTERSAD